MTKDERATLRLAFLTAPIADVPLSVEEACAFTGWSETKLMGSTIPRAKIDGRVTFLRSQIIAYVKARTPHLMEDVA
jgi:hypothetical protein